MGQFRYHEDVQVHHIAFRTEDVARLERFYVEVLGFDVRDRKPQGSVWLSAGPTLLMLEARAGSASGPAEPGIPEGSMELVAFRIEASAREGFRERLARAGVPIEGETPFTLYFRDPDGRRVGLSHYVV
jgi:catechol 2,3-dioxygenase-like lactoylglutathione lyase family enzyme